MDGGVWKAAVHGVAENWTWLSDFTFIFHFHALEKEMATHSSVLAWRIPGTVEPGGLPSMGSHRVGHDWSDLAAAATYRPYSYLGALINTNFGPYIVAWSKMLQMHSCVIVSFNCNYHNFLEEREIRVQFKIVSSFKEMEPDVKWLPPWKLWVNMRYDVSSPEHLQSISQLRTSYTVD